MLVEAAFAASKAPGPLRAFYERVRARRGFQIAIVATARKLAVLCWQLISKGEDYAYQRPSLTARKLRALEFRADMPSRRGRKGSTATYWHKEVRAQETPSPNKPNSPTDSSSPAGKRKSRSKRVRCRHRGATLKPQGGKPVRRGFHPHAPLFGPGSPAPTPILRRRRHVRT
jgi:hypothetical protein